MNKLCKDVHSLNEAYDSMTEDHHEVEDPGYDEDLVNDLLGLMANAVTDPNAFRELAEPYGGIEGYIKMLDSKLDILIGPDDYAEIAGITDPDECEAKGHFWCTVHGICKPNIEEAVEPINVGNELARAASEFNQKGMIGKMSAKFNPLAGKQSKLGAQAAKELRRRITSVLPGAVDLYAAQTDELETAVAAGTVKAEKGTN